MASDKPDHGGRNRDEESRADQAERHQPAAPPAGDAGAGGRPKVNASGTPEVVPDAEPGEPQVRPSHHQKADRIDTSEE